MHVLSSKDNFFKIQVVFKTCCDQTPVQPLPVHVSCDLFFIQLFLVTVSRH